jgi:hypothetical protein
MRNLNRGMNNKLKGEGDYEEDNFINFYVGHLTCPFGNFGKLSVSNYSFSGEA